MTIRVLAVNASMSGYMDSSSKALRMLMFQLSIQVSSLQSQLPLDVKLLPVALTCMLLRDVAAWNDLLLHLPSIQGPSKGHPTESMDTGADVRVASHNSLAGCRP